MKFEGYNSAYDYMVNQTKSKEFREIPDILSKAKLFIIHKDLIINFHLQNCKSKRPYVNLNPYDYQKKGRQKSIDLPFPKIFIEPHQGFSVRGALADVGIWEIIGFLVEEDLYGEKVCMTFFIQLGGRIVTIPVNIDKYLNDKDPKQTNVNIQKDIIVSFLNGIGYEMGAEDVPTKTDWGSYTPREIKRLSILDNSPYYALSNLINALVCNLVDIIQYINSANGKLVWLGTSELDYKKRTKRGQIPYPQAYTIYLKKEINKKGYFFDGYKFHPKYIFDVRGHYRRYKSPRYKNMRGKIKWIKPFKKGAGFYVKKNYEIKKESIRGANS